MHNLTTMIRQMFKSTLFTALALLLCTVPSTTSAAVFSFGTAMEAPVSLRAFPAAGHTRVTWMPASSTSPVSYKVYSRLSNEPDYYPVGTATTAQFDTTYTFAGVNDTVTRLFVVSAISSGGIESSLSEPVMDNDQDGDGITDAREADYGTSVTNADTDSDGLTDGQEAFIYHTDPLVTDTDSDGLSDFVEVINEIRANLPPFAVADAASTTAGVPVSVSVLANDFGGIATSTLALTTQPLHGSATVSTSTGVLSYTPVSTYSGTDTMSYTIGNQNSVTSIGVVTVSVLAGTSTATTTPPIVYASTTPITLDTTAFARTTGNTVSVSHTIGGGNASTTYRLLICGTSAQTSAGANVTATQVTYGSSLLTKASTYLSSPTTSTTPTELWYLSNAPVGTNTVTMTAPSTAATSAVVCTSFNDFYWYVPGQPFTWVPNTDTSATSTATTTPPAATTTPPVATSTISLAPISFATTTFARSTSNTVSLAHTIETGTATTTHRLLICGTSAKDANGANVVSTQVTYGSAAFTKALTYSAAPTASTTPTELWYLENAPVGSATVTVTAPSSAVSTAGVCTSFHDFYWYIPGRVFDW